MSVSSPTIASHDAPDHGYRRALLCLALALATTVGVLGAIGLASSLGNHIHSREIQVDYSLALFWALAIGVAIAFVPVAEEDRTILLWLWATRIVVALGFMLIYEDHYGLDAFEYFRKSQTGSVSLTRAFGDGTLMIQQLARFHYQHLVPSYHAMKLTCGALGLWSVYLVYRATVLFLGHEDRRLLWILGITPTILFWSSILGKDPLAMFGIAIYTYGVVRLLTMKSWSSFITIALGIAIASAIRLWLAPIMILPVVGTIWWSSKSVAIKAFVAIAGVVAFVYAAQPLMVKFKAASAKELLEQIAKRGEGYNRGGSSTGISVDINSWSDFIEFAPKGAFAALFRPLPGEVMNPFGLLAGVEDLVLLMLLARAAFRFHLADLRDPVILWAILFCLIWSAIHGIISAHNLGVAVRYRLQILPVLLLMMLYLGGKDRRVTE
jgi:hypothetical protein